jgi:hypothetical protein
MKTLGTWLLIFGVGSSVLNLIGMEFRLLFWIDAWGPETGWAIRAGMAIVGALLLFVGRITQGDAAAA